MNIESLANISLAALARFCVFVIVSLLGSFPAFSQEAALSVVAEIKVGEPVSVVWTGPDMPGDFIALALPGGESSAFLSYHRTSLGSPALLAISDAGTYELRYISAADLAILAQTSVLVGTSIGAEEVVEEKAGAVVIEAELETSAQSVAAPKGSLFSLAAVDAGSRFRVAWDFPVGPDARVAIVDLATQAPVFSRPVDAVGTLSLTAPTTVGMFEIRLIGPDGISLARREVEVR